MPPERNIRILWMFPNDKATRLDFRLYMLPFFPVASHAMRASFKGARDFISKNAPDMVFVHNSVGGDAVRINALIELARRKNPQCTVVVEDPEGVVRAGPGVLRLPEFWGHNTDSMVNIYAEKCERVFGLKRAQRIHQLAEMARGPAHARILSEQMLGSPDLHGLSPAQALKSLERAAQDAPPRERKFFRQSAEKFRERMRSGSIGKVHKEFLFRKLIRRK